MTDNKKSCERCGVKLPPTQQPDPAMRAALCDVCNAFGYSQAEYSPERDAARREREQELREFENDMERERFR